MELINIDRRSKSLAHVLFLVTIISIGATLRLINLEGKPPWIDEFATIVFSLGNSFKSVPLDRVINFSDLITPLVPHPNASVSDTIRQLFAEDHHPPTYFTIEHLWLKLFPARQGLVDLWGARLLAVIFGSLSIPIIYITSYSIFKSNLIARFTAVMMAISPFGIYLAQEARHYSLAVVWVIISIGCFAITCQCIDRHQRLPLKITIIWLLVNNLGMSTHYFFVLTIGSEAIALMFFILYYPKYSKFIFTTRNTAIDYLNLDKKDRQRFKFKEIMLDLQLSWLPLAIGSIGTGISVIGWLKLFHNTKISIMTTQLVTTINNPIDLISPLFRILAYLTTILSILFTESKYPLLVVISMFVILPFVFWISATSYRIIFNKGRYLSQKYLTEVFILASFCGAAIGLFLLTPLFTGMDITLAARYQFFYFPGIVMLMGVILASCWRLNDRIIVWISGKRSVAVILMMGAIGSCIVTLDLGYCKPYAPADLVANMLIHESYTKNRSTPDPLLIATTHNNLIQVGELMSIAWEIQQVDSNQQRSSTHFLIAHQNQLNCVGNNCPATTTLRNAIDQLSTSTNLWLVNFYAPVMLPSTCKLDLNLSSKTNGYNYSLYHCSEGVNV